MTKLDWAAVFTGLNILLMVILTFRVIGARQKHKVSLGDGGNPAVLQAIRAHGNASETIPIGIGALILLAILDAAPMLSVQVVGAMLTAGRYLHAFGLSSSAGLSFGRGAGTILTALSLVGAAVLLIYAGIAPML